MYKLQVDWDKVNKERENVDPQWLSTGIDPETGTTMVYYEDGHLDTMENALYSWNSMTEYIQNAYEDLRPFKSIEQAEAYIAEIAQQSTFIITKFISIIPTIGD